jgi:hypothetical protein
MAQRATGCGAYVAAPCRDSVTAVAALAISAGHDTVTTANTVCLCIAWRLFSTA